jgi:hypothetical protein
VIENAKTRHEVMVACTAHKDQPEGYADVTCGLEVGDILWARANENETRTLDQERVNVVRFWINGSTTYYWLRPDEFNSSTKRKSAS